MEAKDLVVIAAAVISAALTGVGVAYAVAVAQRQGQLKKTRFAIGLMTSEGPKALEGPDRPEILVIGVPDRQKSTYVYVLPLVLSVPDDAAALKNVWLQVASTRRQAPRELLQTRGAIEQRGIDGDMRVSTVEGKFFTEATLPVLRPGENRVILVGFEYEKAELFRKPAENPWRRRAVATKGRIVAATMVELQHDGYHVTRDIGSACPDPIYIHVRAENARPRALSILLVAQQAENARQLEERAMAAFPGVIAGDLERWWRRRILVLSEKLVFSPYPLWLPPRFFPRYRKLVLFYQRDFSILAGEVACDFSMEGLPYTLRHFEMPWPLSPGGY